ncbi:endonuclease domain-containing protein [Bradyrhizobium sp.]|uniref:endonuclease domain-containing protein n=1 Tax=Bradyrhizobium sp. TaxID=376 RepID=UPI002D2607DF|nr:DUF559 domain-containing protein [Bradyrhizobium sp.]HZR74322.1 DUF559 domain-containing protein [Bradyrhizobium sp.]
MPQTPHHRPTAKRVRNFARRMRPFQSFILDLVCFDKRLVIEIDGSQHLSSERDAAGDAALKAEEFRVARYWNNDVLRRPAAVLEDIVAKLAEP